LNPERERQWVERAQQGDAEAFRHLYTLYFPRVYASVAYRVGDAQDTQDLVSEVFLKVVEDLGRFEWRGPGSFAAWLFRVAHNLVSDHHRRHRRRAKPLPLDALPEVQTNTGLPDDAALRKEAFSRLHELINTLSPRRQEVITLRFFAGLRNREIAEVLGLDERTVASHLCRGLEDLHRKWVEESMPVKEEGSR